MATLIVLGIYTVFFTGTSTQAATKQVLEVSEVRSMGNQVTVPIILRNIKYLTSLQFTVSADSANVTVDSFKPSETIDSEAFKATGNITNNEMAIDFSSQTGQEQQVKDKAVVIGYITYNLSEQFSPDQAVLLSITNAVAKGKKGAEFTLEKLDGKIERGMPVGDELVISASNVQEPCVFYSILTETPLRIVNNLYRLMWMQMVVYERE